MKQLKLSFIAVMAIMIATAAASSAFTTYSKPGAFEERLHWFRASDGAYLGFEYKSVMEAGVCAGNGSPCASGYSEIAGDPGEEEPVTATFVESIQKN